MGVRSRKERNLGKFFHFLALIPCGQESVTLAIAQIICQALSIRQVACLINSSRGKDVCLPSARFQRSCLFRGGDGRSLGSLLGSV